VFTATWKAPATPGYNGAIQRTVNTVVLSRLMSLAADEHASSQVRAVVLLKLDELKKWIASQETLLKDVETRAEFFFARNQIDHFEKNPAEVHLTAPAAPPAGDPIGSDGWD
jgi:hypothetical protein